MLTELVNFLLAVLTFGFNLLVFVAISSDSRLHTPTYLLSCNLWLSNLISATIAIFYSIGPTHSLTGIICLQKRVAFSSSSSSPPSSPAQSQQPHSTSDCPSLDAHSVALLLNSSISMLSLLAIGILHVLYRYHCHVSKCQAGRLAASSWLLMFLLLPIDCFLVSLSDSALLAVSFQLAFLAVLLFLNLILHPLNLFLFARSPATSREGERLKLLNESGSVCLWLLLDTLSLIIIALIVLWETKHQKSSYGLNGIEIAAFSVHCVANPLIAIIRDRRLESSVARLLLTNKQPRLTADEELVLALMRDRPPRYSTSQLES